MNIIGIEGRVKDLLASRLDVALLDATILTCWTGECGLDRIIFDIIFNAGAFRATFRGTYEEHQ